jgi:hypothetical protein
MVIFTMPHPRTLVPLAGFVALLASTPAGAQTAQTAARPSTSPTTPASPAAKAPAKEPAPKPKSTFGTTLTKSEARALLGEMQQLTEQALATSRAAEQASSVAEVKTAADKVLQTVWGAATGRGEGNASEIRVPGWKERWQVTGAEWDSSYYKRLGTAAPKITDPRQLGAMGRGRAVRGRLWRITSGALTSTPADSATAAQVFASLSNVIGWTYISEGLKGREMQPRISLTYLWDAPSEFWQSTADTGWLDEVFAQAVNILKTDYGNDVAEARKHAAGMSELLQKVLTGVDADKNGTVEPKMMEGGLNAAVRAAGEAGV